MRAAQALEIANQGQRSIGLTPPADAANGWQLDQQIHGLKGTAEVRQGAAMHGLITEIDQRSSQDLRVTQDGGQDGEVGHGGNARFS